MKGFKKLLTGILAATMIFSMGITAGAASTADATTTIKSSIEIDSKNANQDAPYDEKKAPIITYDYYKIFDADILSIDKTNDKNSTVAYYVTNGEFADLIKGTNLFKVTAASTASGSRWNIELAKDGITGEDIAKALNDDAIKGHASVKHGDFKSANGTAKVENLDPGYYLIVSSLGTVAAVQTVGDVKINEKNTYPTVTKIDDQIDVEMFNTVVTYKITVNVPQNVADEKPIKVVDTATKGLTFDTKNESIVVKVDDTEVKKLTWTAGTSTDAKNVYVTEIPYDVVYGNRGKNIVLTYTATVNENAVVLVKETNTAHIEYDNYSSSETEEVDVVTLGLKIKKVDGSNTTKTLTGAEFTLWDSKEGGKQIPVIKVVKDNGEVIYRVASKEDLTAEKPNGDNIAVDENGLATVIGLKAKEYYLQEEVAPTGYNKLNERETCDINYDTEIKNKELTTFSIINNSGSILPSTGGVGTTIFYVVGGMLIIAGVAFFMLRRKAIAD
ncbi:SpaH/EbpB family LPXTG-anchored major pilin [Butyrivibrio sp. YAB3001]|uniref:SpaH/EbpB family LPXTG-anchored major pilin n=1 Tax=Butyrivibrio sp. YAB3001 TaxID=1520812 RepID=UPI0008F669D1|nr:SpaH/EbpB family LPXTG-anchored major pilin [Butyrivibrio sp. YAB3001]SFC43397.1 LPXTG-motif cell wall anchor domain-containing protein/fimbrial isopeptide formation D2 domain-containing protein [Butyrivibrio sp. YAB3001]